MVALYCLVEDFLAVQGKQLFSPSVPACNSAFACCTCDVIWPLCVAVNASGWLCLKSSVVLM